MKARCYYCNKELTEKNIKKHMRNCNEMKKRIDKLSSIHKKQRNQFIIAIKPKYIENEYCIYLSIDGNLGLEHIDKFLRDVWLECCGHLSCFKINGKYYQDDSMNIKLNDILNFEEKFQYEYDFGEGTYLILEVVDIIRVPISFSQVEIIARNHEISHMCKNCGAEAKYFNYENREWECENCIDESNDMVDKFDYCNSPRDGACCYKGYKENENEYLPGNTKRYKLPKKRMYDEDDFDDSSFDEDDFFDELLDVDYDFQELINQNKAFMKSVFTKGIYSFDIKELISNLSKDNIYDIAKYLGMTRISSLNKSKLIEKILNEYEGLIEEKISLFDEERYKFLKDFTNNDGVKFLNKIDGESSTKVEYFIKRGILFSGTKDGEIVILMPEIIQKLINEKNNIKYRRTIKLNTEIVNIYRGMNKAYGILKVKDIKELFKIYEIEESEDCKIEALIKSAEDYYKEYENQGIFFVNCYIENWVDLLKVIEQQKNVDYAMISKDELLSMSNENYLYESNFGNTFFKEFLNVFNMDNYILEGLMDSLYLEIQENELQKVIDDILEQLEDNNEDIKDFMCNSVEKFLKNIRLWRFKGDCLNEKKVIIKKDEKKNLWKRNASCPCGSGKRYKDCCARSGNVIKLF